MRVLHISAGNMYGGVETLLSTLARQRELCPEMSPRFALCFEGRLSAELRQAGVPVDCLGEVRTRRVWTVWRARRRLRELLSEQPCDVIVCHSPWAQAIFGPAARSAGERGCVSAPRPLVCWLHAGPQGKHWLERWAKRTRPDGVICNSHFTAQHLGNLYPDVPAEVIYCPVNMAELQETMQEQGFGMRRSSPLWLDQTKAAKNAALQTTPPEDNVVIIQVSRIEPLKGHRLHLEALARLIELPRWECWFVGGAQQPSEQRYLQEIKGIAARLGIGDRVRFLGQRSDVRRLLIAADIYCQPNVSPDSFGITFIEALLHQLPVVTTAMGGALEIVDSSCGVLVPPNDPAALGDCLRQLILDADLRSRLGKSGPRRARELCDPVRQMGKIADFFHRTLKQKLAA